MATRSLVIITISVLLIASLAVALQWCWAQTPEGDEQKQGVPAVAAVAAESVTEYEPDPFEPERVRSSVVRVRRIAVVYSDGTVELKDCR